MRPKRLTIEGLRSYRDRTIIDFSEASLFAVVGDTGSGKSSILEAVVYALYAAATWTKQPGELITDGMRTMTVELLFEVDQREWVVRRSMSRGGYPPPLHYLYAVDEPADRYDGAANVDAKVESLLGLSLDAFCAAVVLPQGRFERLLNETPANRTRILKGIFRLERLDEARDLAKRLIDDYRPPYEALRRSRARLLDDPAIALKDAKGRVATARQRISALSSVQTSLRQLIKEREQLAQRARHLGDELSAIRTALSAVNPTEGERLHKLGSAIEAEERDLEAQAAAAASELSLAEAAVSEAAAKRFDQASLARYRTTLEHAETSIPAISRRKEQVRAEIAAQADEEAALASLAADLVRLRETASTAQEREQSARAALVEAERHRDEARSAVRALTELTARLAKADDSLASARRDVAVAEAESKKHSVTLGKATEAVGHAEAKLEAAQSRSAAATAAHGHQPGDPCPVCSRKLPPSWAPPTNANLGPARDELAKAKSRLEEAGRMAGDSEQRVAAAREREKLVADQRLRLVSEQTAAVTSLLAAIPGWSPDTPASQALGGLEANVDVCEQEVEDAHTSRAHADSEVAGTTAKLEQRRLSLGERSKETHARQQQIEADAAGIRRSLSSLPVECSVDEASTTEDFERALANLEALEDAAAKREQKVDGARKLLAKIAEALDQTRLRRRRELEEPRARHEAHLSRLEQALARAEGVLQGHQTTSSSVFARAAAIAKSMEREAAAVQSSTSAVDTKSASVLAAAGLQDDVELERALRVATGEEAVATADAKRAESDLPRAKKLDRDIRTGGELLATVEELARLLGDGQFVGYVVAARQRALLAIGSAILGEMSGGRYGFADDFEIIDRGSGQPRSPKTLSGGESFQASLSLALALVELAGRSGGRLSSLFLDEGFGTLDANALDEALEELERRAEAGRVIGVISHLRSVADRLEHVLRVEKELGRTRVRWATREDLGEMSAADLGHLAGLTA